jgi:hypothetical protein
VKARQDFHPIAHGRRASMGTTVKTRKGFKWLPFEHEPGRDAWSLEVYMR